MNSLSLLRPLARFPQTDSHSKARLFAILGVLFWIAATSLTASIVHLQPNEQTVGRSSTKKGFSASGGPPFSCVTKRHRRDPGRTGGCCHCSPGSRRCASASSGMSPPSSTCATVWAESSDQALVQASFGYESNLNQQGTFHFGYLFLTHSHFASPHPRPSLQKGQWRYQ